MELSASEGAGSRKVPKSQPFIVGGDGAGILTAGRRFSQGFMTLAA
jgi:hypothetical protein